MLIKINVLQASGHLVRNEYGTRIIDANKIDEIRDAPHVQARDKDGNKVPDVDGKAQYEKKAVHLIRYMHGSNVSPVMYTVRGTVGEWRTRINAARIDGNALPEPAKDA